MFRIINHYHFIELFLLFENPQTNLSECPQTILWCLFGLVNWQLRERPKITVHRNLAQTRLAFLFFLWSNQNQVFALSTIYSYRL